MSALLSKCNGTFFLCFHAIVKSAIFSDVTKGSDCLVWCSVLGLFWSCYGDVFAVHKQKPQTEQVFELRFDLSVFPPSHHKGRAHKSHERLPYSEKTAIRSVWRAFESSMRPLSGE